MAGRRPRVTTIHSLGEIPSVRSEAEEAAYWQTHEMSVELWRSLPPPSAAVEAALAALRRAESGREGGDPPIRDSQSALASDSTAHKPIEAD